jgi:hypothetical protein
VAYQQAEAGGIPVWCQDEAGPYQAIPQPGATWEEAGHPACQPHEYVRGGTAKLLTLFHPATGQVRARGVTSSANAVLHPWLRTELTAILADLPPAPDLPVDDLPAVRRWETWLDELPPEPLPPIRLILVWDNLAGHKTRTLVAWLHQQGIVPLYTPLSGSWLNMAESVQCILKERALAGTHPQTSAELIAWLEATVRGWNRVPTPFVWGGKRKDRRERARARWRARRLRGSAALLPNAMPIAA